MVRDTDVRAKPATLESLSKLDITEREIVPGVVFRLWPAQWKHYVYHVEHLDPIIAADEGKDDGKVSDESLAHQLHLLRQLAPDFSDVTPSEVQHWPPSVVLGLRTALTGHITASFESLLGQGEPEDPTAEAPAQD